MTWFSEAFGFNETSPATVRQMTRVDGPWLVSEGNGRRFHIGTLTTPSLAELRVATASLPPRGPCTRREVVADARALHQAPEAANAVFQVASQFNLLEMVSPDVEPERGITGYVNDRTQGPACAMAAAPGTLYRCHWVPVGGQLGQTRARQLDMLTDIASLLGNGPMWQMKNGYVLASAATLRSIGGRVAQIGAETVEDALRIGVQEDTEVLGSTQRVTQVYGSALPVAYNAAPEADWEPLARAVLTASYDATLHVARLRAAQTGCHTVFLTLLGGGAFGNPTAWILDAMNKATARHAQSGLDIAVVSYGRSQHSVREWCSQT